ncbi:hypothetical protein [Sporosarcina sp. NPDC096371]
MEWLEGIDPFLTECGFVSKTYREDRMATTNEVVAILVRYFLMSESL